MQRKHIHTLAVACGAAFTLATLAAEPPAVEENSSIKGDTRQTAQSESHAGCTGSEETSQCETAAIRCEKAAFLLGSQNQAAKDSGFKPTESFEFADGFFDNRPDPLTLRPMFASELLQRFDADDNGTLSGQEQTTTKVFLAARSEQHKDALLERFDLNKDGKLDTNEKVEARQWLFHEQTQNLNAFIEMFDADMDEFLSDAELELGKQQNAQMFFTVYFYEGMNDSFSYRDGPELAREHAEAIEEISDSLADAALAKQQEHLDSIFANPENSVASGQSTKTLSSTVAEVETGDRPD